jgi:cysteine desulfurase
MATAKRNSETKRLMTLRDNLQKSLTDRFEQAVISGSKKRQLANFLHISFPGLDAERLIFRLEARGVMVATGSACAANMGTRSHVLNSIGMEPAVADGSLRITLGKLSNEDNMTKASQILIDEISAEIDRGGAV